MKKRVLKVLAIVLLLSFIILITYLYLKKEPDSKKIKEDAYKAENYEGLKFSNIDLYKEGNQYTLYLDVTNVSNVEKSIEKVSIILKDKDHKKVGTLMAYIGSPMKAKETRKISTSTTMDLSQTTEKEIREYK